MDKLKRVKEIEDEVKNKDGFMIFNIVDNGDGTVTIEPVSLEEFRGESFPEVFEIKEYPTRISAGMHKILQEDELFFIELMHAYKRFLNGDWGLDEWEYREDIERFNRYPETATGYYKTSWGDIQIKRDYTFTTAYLPFER